MNHQHACVQKWKMKLLVIVLKDRVRIITWICWNVGRSAQNQEILRILLMTFSEWTNQFHQINGICIIIWRNLYIIISFLRYFYVYIFCRAIKSCDKTCQLDIHVQLSTNWCWTECKRATLRVSEHAQSLNNKKKVVQSSNCGLVTHLIKIHEVPGVILNILKIQELFMKIMYIINKRLNFTTCASFVKLNSTIIVN